MEDTLYDYPCSSTFRRYEDYLLERESPPRYLDDYDRLQREVDEEMYWLELKHHLNVLGVEDEPRVKESIGKGARETKKAGVEWRDTL